MNRTTKWVGLLGVWAALTAGPGCMLFDDYCEDYDDRDDRHYGNYQRETQRPTTRQPVDETREAGVYQEKK